MEGPSGSLVPQGLRRASEWSWRLLLVAAAVLAVGWGLSKIYLIVVVVIGALLLTALLNPIAARLRRAGWGSGPATAVAMAVGLLTFGGFIALIVPAVAEEFGEVGDRAAAGVREAQRWLTSGPLDLSEEQVDGIANGLVEQLRGSGESVATGVLSGALAVGEVIAGILLALVLTVFFVRDGRQIFDYVARLLPAGGQPRAREIGDIVWDTLAGYIRGIASVGLVDAVFIGLALLILGVPLVLPLMLLTFVGAFVPIVGATIAGFVSALIALVDEGVTASLILIGVIILVQQLEGHVLYPVIMRRAVDVHPVAILIGVAVGALVAGVFGAIIAVPVVAIAGRVIELVRRDDAEAREAAFSSTDATGDRGVLLDPAGDAPPQAVSAHEVQSAASSRPTSS